MISPRLLRGIGQICPYRRLLSCAHFTSYTSQNKNCITSYENRFLEKNYTSGCNQSGTLFTKSTNGKHYTDSPLPMIKKSLAMKRNAVMDASLRTREKTFLNSSTGRQLNTLNQAGSKTSKNTFFKTLIFHCQKKFPSVRNYTATTHAMKDIGIKSKVTSKDIKVKEIKAKVRGIQKDISPLTTRRIVRRKKTKDASSKDQVMFQIGLILTNKYMYCKNS